MSIQRNRKVGSARAGRMCARAVVLMCSIWWLGCSIAGDEGASLEEDADAGPDLVDAGEIPNPFVGAGSLTCMELDLLWHEELGTALGADGACSVDADCALARTSVTCGSSVSIGGCDTSVAASSLGTWESRHQVLAQHLCGEVSISCNSTSLCRIPLARCVSGECRNAGP